jgi:hypothetical protein
MKPLAITLSGTGGVRGRDGGGDLANVQCRPMWSVPMNPPIQQIYPDF